MSKFFVSAALLLAGLSADFAQSQEPAPADLAKGTCAVLESLTASAGTRFEQYRGKEVTPGVYEATIWISGFQSCSVFLGDVDMYSCTRPTQSEIIARMLYQIATEKVGECVRDWTEDLPLDVQDERYEMIAGKRFIKNVGGGKITIGLAHGMGKSGSKPDHFVSLGVTMSKKEAVSS